MMLALTFTCRALLVFLLSESVQSDRKAPFLITENMWPRGCVLSCQRGRHGAVCGSNGRLYKSLCAFQRAQCINTQLRIAPRAHCSDPAQTKCQLARAQGLEARARSGRGSLMGPAAPIFVPECSPEGHFLPMQCHSQAGYCWCSTPDGKPVSGTTVFQGTPDCTDHIPKLTQATDADSTLIKGEPGPTSDPRKPAELTAPPFWVTILMNSEPKRNCSARQSTDSPLTCERERALLLSQVRLARQEERFIPECSADGRYNPVQCHTATGYCWCVRVDSGRPFPGTSARNRIPDCTGADTLMDRRHWEKPLPGCPGPQKKEFLQSLIRALQLEAEHSGTLYNSSKLSPSNSSLQSSNPPSSTTSSSSSPLDVVPSIVPPETKQSSRSEEVLRWHFIQLDLDSSGMLSEREARPLRQFLRRRLKPRRCAKKFSQYCDRNGDRGLTLEELRLCLGL
ncbi:SPARC-related modular calcium-binding protein 1-like isoform X2 [Melanotaenia boesemani]|uniref:SPARC-related modular calcium-binding protein 1-like isoform X2 n=1 Tax=Melanotaenia boesemani TaxID=1250792 RepID=UPI001C057D63|nr:SPARC-related modular calcium-binding protein 1-like isoform X2 [Melanotaenia boesemani]